MGRPSHSRALGVWANGIRVGRWVMPASGPVAFWYDSEWLASKECRPLSLSLPLNFDGVPLKGDKVSFFFDNLLPDSEVIRQRVRTRFRTPSGDAFDLLAAIGRDCVGALQLLADDETPEGLSTISTTALSESEVERELLHASSPGSGAYEDSDDFRISLAGAQEKTALTWHRGRWCRPRGATPTTHIFKLPLGLVGGRQMDMTTSLENEWLCARILGAYGLPVASCEIERFGATRALVVARFDRALHASKRYWLRLPQEDFCQALGAPSSLKYESDGGPGIDAIARVLQGSESREDDLRNFLLSQLLFWLLAATDGHAKNYSIHLLAEGRYRMTPLYDVLSAWPVTGTRQNEVHRSKLKLAMALRGSRKHYRISEIHRRHFNAMAERYLGSDMESQIERVIDKTPAVIDSVRAKLLKGFPSRVFDAVTKGLQRAVQELARMPP